MITGTILLRAIALMHTIAAMRATAQVRTFALACMLLAAALAHSAHAAEFSAEIVSRDAAGSPLAKPAKIFVSNRLVRIETTEAADGFFLIDADTDVARFILPKLHAIMDARQSSRFTQTFVAVDADDPCRQWQAAATNARGGASTGWHCEKLEERATGGRSLVGYRVADADAPATLLWVDAALNFPVKLSAADGSSAALEHIRIEAQPAELFTVPAGFHRFDPQALIERIKHSDVWVNP
jgi:hypothetical protein